METTGSEVLILGNSNTEKVLCLLNQQLEAPSLVQLHDSVVLSDEHLSYFNGQLFITGLNGKNTLVCSQRPVNAPQYAYTQDVAVIGLEAPDIYITLPNYHAEWSDINVTISNLSTDTLQRVTLSSVMSKFTFLCPYYSDFIQTWEALNLPPGQSTTLNIPYIDWGSIGIYSPNIQMCFTASLPNDSLDATPLNNRICKPFLQIIPVNEATLNPEFYLSPNPATSMFSLMFPENIIFPVQLTITNPFGQVMYEKNLSEWVMECPVHHWPSGYYTVHIRNDLGKRSSRPLIVQH